MLESGAGISPVTLAYETCGSLNKDKTNVILVLHALSGDSHMAGYYAICSQTLQQVYEPSSLIHAMMRVARMGVVSFPNFGHFKVRMQLAVTGSAPITKELPYSWHDTPNIRVLSLNDFQKFSDPVGFKIFKTAAINTRENQRHGRRINFLPNLFATYGIFLIGKKSP